MTSEEFNTLVFASMINIYQKLRSRLFTIQGGPTETTSILVSGCKKNVNICKLARYIKTYSANKFLFRITNHTGCEKNV